MNEPRDPRTASATPPLAPTLLEPTLAHFDAPHASSASPNAVPVELANHPRYRLVDVLGEGGMGTVYRAEHRLMKRWVAIKVVRHVLLERPAVRERFLNELHTSARLVHPNIVVAHDAEEAGNLCFLVMEYVAGEDLAGLIRKRGPLPVAEACGYVRQAALGLQHAHENGLVHRDIKPGNLMLTPEGRVKVLDFGLACLTLENAADQVAGEATTAAPAPSNHSTMLDGAQRTATGVLLGTPAYMAPEQARDARHADIRADVYSLGCTLVHLLTGRPPPVVLSECRSDIPIELNDILKRLLAESPQDRYQTPAEVARVLSPFAGTDEAAGRRRFARTWLVVAAAAVLLGIFGLIGMLNGWWRDSGSASNREYGTLPYEDARAPTQVVTFVAIPNPTLEGTPVMLNIRVAPRPPNVGQPDGEVTVRSGEEVLGTAPVREGQASLKVTAGKIGRYSLTANYGGDDAYAPSTSPPLVLRVGAGAVYRFTVIGPPTGTFTLSFNGQTGAPLRCGADPMDVRLALTSLASIGGVSGDVAVTKERNGYTVTFIGALGATRVPLINGTGSPGVSVSVVTLRQGVRP